MADGIALDSAGVPAVVLCTDAFRAAADAMATIQGFPGYRYVAVPHPLASLVQGEVRARAERVWADVLAILGVDR